MKVNLRNAALTAAICMTLGACNTVGKQKADLSGGQSVAAAAVASPKDSAKAEGRKVSGRASWYGPGFHGRKTASGERFNPSDHTAAHRTLPFGTKVLVENASTGRSVIVRINDRGPFHGNRVIDLSRGAAQSIGLTGAGVGDVSMTVIANAD